jgi:hypothetical protein
VKVVNEPNSSINALKDKKCNYFFANLGFLSTRTEYISAPLRQMLKLISNGRTLSIYFLLFTPFRNGTVTLLNPFWI